MATMTIAATYDSSTVPHYVGWGQMFGQALTQFGWVPQTGHGELVDNGLTGASYAWSNVVAGPGATSLASVINYTFKGAFVGGTTYVGGNLATTNNVDVVTSSGLTYVHITASSSLATAPAADTTNWMPFNFSIFKSNGPLSSTAPIYLKIAFIQNPSVANTPCLLLGIGKGVDSDGNLTQPMQLSNSTPVGWVRSSNTLSLSGSTFNCNFSGDADNIRWILWQNLGSSQTTPNLMSIDRAYTSAGTQSDAYWTAYYIYGSSSCQSALQFKNSLGGGNFFDGSRWSGSLAFSSASISNMGAICATPVTPLIGYQAAPTLGVMQFGINDVTDGSIQPVWMYGATHLYLVFRNVGNGFAPSGINATGVPAILWE
jgi:hypothetical protein